MTTNVPVVKNFVIPLERYPNLNENQTLHDAVQTIQSYTCKENDHIKYAELLILNDQNQLVGIVSLEDLLQGLDPRLVKVPKVKGFEGKEAELSNLTIMWEDSFFEECSKRKQKLIKDFMSPIKRVVRGSDPILKALSIMLNTTENTLPVAVNDKVVGVIRFEEIFTAICNQCKL